MLADTSQNLVAMFLDQAAKRTNQPFLWAKTGKAYQSRSWGETAEAVSRLARALRARGIRAGDRVVLVSENRPEWLIADLAIMAAGGVTVPTYTTNTHRDHQHILENSQARAAIVSTARLSQTLLPAAHQSDALEFVITMEPPKVAQSINADMLDWHTVLDEQTPDVAAEREIASTIARSDTACIIYTSGTGGAPKGVMLHHGAVLHNCGAAADVIRSIGLDNHVFLSFLPLSHAYEHSAGQFLPIAIGAQIYYAQGIDKLASNMIEAKPTIMVVVPRLFEMLRMRVTRAMQQKGGVQAAMFERALDLGTKTLAGKPLSRAERMQDRLLEGLVRRKVRDRFGGRLKALVSGGAPLNAEVGQFFMAFGLPLLQGYGQTEAAPVISVNRPGYAKTHTVGPPLKDVRVRIAEDGEILVRGELVMQGYWRNDRETRRAVVDGWLHTGDIGHIDADGHLVITDRKKDIIVNDKGDNVSPQRIEGMLALEPEIGQAMIYGDRKPHLVALIVPDAEWLSQWAHQHGKPGNLAALGDDADLRAALDAAVSRVNKRLNNLEKVRRFVVARAPFEIENEELTPTMKIRRHVIRRNYEPELEALYGGH
ncbi:long-chain acyl-CoA synthetase [Rhodothalassium salexigens DSM 2132]|uniref:Long-chain acyl-CoA synthetase n=1 Tax=Rhodothalassium salexigens DSM 2132 TaxID=1188247 RepID=A0A4R2PKT6_RHOSA|nr:long-chain fatty acid--CoA ligase [Rhodothalassium salexigens]MBB4211377.1 long-chain acyl-CoA synthetase [Rhodothalassium salexigens DSM 2132]MBK1637710.1 long-chain fatty acid--CoA ligase [Rhodothalassium salexigens DSM 2132]TCP35298.1 long-chain acyl-CoA synthetase [Rhodothalassium salexigens DSM 2132]